MTAESSYERALRAYLLTKYIPSATTCLKAISQLPPNNNTETEQLRLNIWTLYLNIASTLLTQNKSKYAQSLGLGNGTDTMEHIGRLLWSKLVNEGYGDTSSIHPQLMTVCVVLYIQLNVPVVGKEFVESWFAGLSDTALDHISMNIEYPDVLVKGYLDTVNLYVTQLLPALNDYESAFTFIEYNSVLPDSIKKSLVSSIEEQKNRLEKDEKEQEVKRQKEIEEKKRREQAQLVEKKRIEIEEEQKRQAKKVEESLLIEKQKEAIEKQKELIEKDKAEPQIQMTSRSIQPREPMQLLIKKWMGHLTAKGIASYSAVLVILFTLLALFRGQRGRLTLALQALLSKLWQTVKMGTKVTHM
ncbi:hypothetical protein BDB01DRAFT_804536 [Pilobolus umbonatus]|nr:hypothetical protein BDB01DRAFT_804536 [Pilobolus umbonatus]